MSSSMKAPAAASAKASAARSKAESLTSDVCIQYLRQHNVPASVNDIIARILATKPSDPLVVMEKAFREESRLRAAAAATNNVRPRVRSPRPAATSTTTKKAPMNTAHDEKSAASQAGRVSTPPQKEPPFQSSQGEQHPTVPSQDQKDSAHHPIVIDRCEAADGSSVSASHEAGDEATAAEFVHCDAPTDDPEVATTVPSDANRPHAGEGSDSAPDDRSRAGHEVDAPDTTDTTVSLHEDRRGAEEGTSAIGEPHRASLEDATAAQEGDAHSIAFEEHPSPITVTDSAVVLPLEAARQQETKPTISSGESAGEHHEGAQAANGLMPEGDASRAVDDVGYHVVPPLDHETGDAHVEEAVTENVRETPAADKDAPPSSESPQELWNQLVQGEANELPPDETEE
jgi:hypothetical protein